jgi:hypothetical protein
MWEYLAAHPWWALVYLLTICSTISFCVTAFASRSHDKKRKKQDPSQREDLH